MLGFATLGVPFFAPLLAAKASGIAFCGGLAYVLARVNGSEKQLNYIAQTATATFHETKKVGADVVKLTGDVSAFQAATQHNFDDVQGAIQGLGQEQQRHHQAQIKATEQVQKQVTEIDNTLQQVQVTVDTSRTELKAVAKHVDKVSADIGVLNQAVTQNHQQIGMRFDAMEKKNDERYNEIHSNLQNVTLVTNRLLDKQEQLKNELVATEQQLGEITGMQRVQGEGIRYLVEQTKRQQASQKAVVSNRGVRLSGVVLGGPMSNQNNRRSSDDQMISGDVNEARS